MLIARTLDDLQRMRPPGGLALVPTMGALHDGHLSLIEAARALGLPVAASLFVNPTQFGPGEDFATYPRDEAGDLARLERARCTLAWLPAVATMYPPQDATAIEVAGPAQAWEGALRPGHFRGVATVVARLFGQTRCSDALFGEKDWQQLQVIRRMVADLCLPVRIHGVATRREADGLAMSSRNRYLTAAERALAPLLHRTLLQLAGTAAAAADIAGAEQALSAAGFAPDYLACVDGETLRPLDQAREGARLIAAARLGRVRLLDNVATDRN